MRADSRARRFASAVACCLALAACSPPAAPVAYSGDVLGVDGRTYAPRARTGPFLPGHVIAVARKGRADELARDLGRLGLRASRAGTTIVQFIVAVPGGCELLWGEALRDGPAVEAAGEDRIYHPAA